MIDLRTGSTLWSYQGDLPLHPASCTKLITTFAALELLGPSYRFQTKLSVGSGRRPPLYWEARGDPKIVSEQLWLIARRIRRAGIREVGDLIFNTRAYGKERLAPGFEEKPGDQQAYRAASGALSVNFNRVAITVTPGKEGARPRVTLEPDGGYLRVKNQAKSRGRGRSRIRASLRRRRGKETLTISGSIPRDHAPQVIYRRIDDPLRFSAAAIREALKGAGVRVRGKVREGRAPRGARRLFTHDSPPLGQLVADVNKFSNNFMAEQLLRAIGLERRGRGGWREGISEVEGFLRERVGLRDFTYHNGSGLFGQTSFSAAHLVKLLRVAHQRSRSRPEFLSSLPLGGHDGTLAKRLSSLESGRVRAKTGTLNGVSALCGYLSFADDRPGAFCFLMNGLTVKARAARALQDEMLWALLRWRPAPR